MRAKQKTIYFSNKFWFWIIFSTSLTIKGFIFFNISPYKLRFFTPDARLYRKLSRNLVRHGKYATFSSKKGVFVPETARTPGYPAFLAIIRLCTPQNVPMRYIVAIVQCILGALTSGLVYLLSRKLFNQTAAVIAGFLATWDITSSTIANLMLSDSLFVFLLFCSVYMLIIGIIEGKRKLFLAAGFFLGMASLCRPIALYSVIIVIILYVYNHEKISIYNVISFLFPFFLLVGSWKVRNYYQTGDSVFSTLSYFFVADAASGVMVDNQPSGNGQRDIQQDIISLIENEEMRLKNLDIEQKSSIYWNIAIYNPQIYRLSRDALIKYLTLYPTSFLKKYLINFITFVAKPDYESYIWCFGGTPYLRIVWSWDTIWNIVLKKHWFFAFLLFQVLWMFLLWSGFVYGLVWLSGERMWIYLLTMIVLYFTLIPTVSHIVFRYRMPVIPFLAMGAGYGIAGLIEKKRNKTKKPQLQ